jgi:hypothetical protein
MENDGLPGAWKRTAYECLGSQQPGKEQVTVENRLGRNSYVGRADLEWFHCRFDVNNIDTWRRNI